MTHKKRRKFNPYEQVVLETLLRGRRKLSTKQVADISGLSWSTVKKHLLSLQKKRYLNKVKLANKICWWIKK